ncbi:MAG: hypothetical protein H7Y28_08650 [Rhodoferax sp.]|nr:hypothetical protein [Rhodoferax sp.]
MDRRNFICAALSATPVLAWSHHGWSSFDQNRPLYLEGTVRKSIWQNPHAEMVLELSPGLKLPADLAQRQVPAQTALVDGRAVLSKAVLPTRSDRLWEIELAPISRMLAWSVAEIKVGDTLAVVGFTFSDEKGAAVLRCEYLFAAGKTYALRSSPA